MNLRRNTTSPSKQSSAARKPCIPSIARNSAATWRRPSVNGTVVVEGLVFLASPTVVASLAERFYKERSHENEVGRNISGVARRVCAVHRDSERRRLTHWNLEAE